MSGARLVHVDHLYRAELGQTDNVRSSDSARPGADIRRVVLLSTI